MRERIHAVQTSPRERARRTAEAVAAASGVPLETAEPLDEIDFGDWTGLDFAALEGRPAWRAWNEARGRARCPGGESMAEAADRALAHLSAVAAARPGQRVAVVSHADIIRGLVARVLGLPLDNLLRFEIGPASISRIEIAEWGGRVLGLNETTDDDGGRPPGAADGAAMAAAR